MKLVWRNTHAGWVIDKYDREDNFVESKPATSGRPEYIRMYTEGPCAQIQAYLRAGSEDYDPSKNFGLPIRKVIRGIDREMTMRSLRRNSTPAKVWMMDDGELLSHRDGDTIVDKGYTSTTVNKSIFSGSRSTMYCIDGLTRNAGCMVDDLSQYDEFEFLMKRGSEYRVIEELDREINFGGCKKQVHCVRLQYVGRIKGI